MDRDPIEIPVHGEIAHLEQVHPSLRAAGIRKLTVRQLRGATVMAEENLWFVFCVKQRTGNQRFH